jgi:NAD+ diphosphatase
MLPRGATALPRVASPQELGVRDVVGVGSWDGVDVVLGVDAQPPQPPEGWEFVGLRPLLGVLGSHEAGVLSRAVQLHTFERTHRFCGTCGAATTREPAERARRCPACGAQQWPRVTPAVIVLVHRGEEVLLARAARFAQPLFSTLAGFVEAGESLEDTVHREIAEEVGVEVEDLRYFGSQGWPFPHSLMVAFVARYKSGTIRVDADEIVEANWFGKDNLPRIPPPPSIARAMIDAFVAGRLPGR